MIYLINLCSICVSRYVHVGIYREPLSLCSQQQAQSGDGDVGKLVNRVKKEYAILTEEHGKEAAEVFNDDAKYKRFMTEAIEAKSLALKKISIYIESFSSAPGDGDLLQRIAECPLLKLKDESIEMELRTGLAGFPWAQAMRDATVVLGSWRPEGVEAFKLREVAGALAGNQQLRTVTFGDERLDFRDGWAGVTDQDWSKSKAVQAAPGIAALLLGCCTNLTRLDLR